MYTNVYLKKYDFQNCQNFKITGIIAMNYSYKNRLVQFRFIILNYYLKYLGI